MQKTRPNPSLERTSTGKPLSSNVAGQQFGNLDVCGQSEAEVALKQRSRPLAHIVRAEFNGSVLASI
jgi:hypothetical protein